MAGLLLFIAAIPAGLAPRRYWQAIDVYLPVYRAASASSLATLTLGLAIGVPAFLRYLQPGMWMPLTFFVMTPRGLFFDYLAVTGVIRFVAWFIDDPWGDPAVTVLDAVVRRQWAADRERDVRRARERREGPEVPDVLMTGADLGIADVDFVVIASRRKPDWGAGAIVVTDEKWFKLGEAVEQQMPGGWRTLYPLHELHHHEVLRRAVHYTLPRLRRARPISTR